MVQAWVFHVHELRYWHVVVDTLNRMHTMHCWHVLHLAGCLVVSHVLELRGRHLLDTGRGIVVAGMQRMCGRAVLHHTRSKYLLHMSELQLGHVVVGAGQHLRRL